MVAVAPRNAAKGVIHGKARRGQHGENGAHRGAAGNAQHVRIGQRIAQQGLKARARDRERRSDQNSQQNARQANLHHDQPEIGGDSLGLAGHQPPQILLPAPPSEKGTAPSRNASSTTPSSTTARKRRSTRFAAE